MTTRALQFGTTASLPEWEERYEDLAYTAFAMMALSGDPDLAPLLGKLRAVLTEWEGIEAERRQARGAAVAAKSRVKIVDAALDVALAKLAEAAIAAAGEEGRKGELYQRFFPEDHEQVLALGLDAELPLAMAAVAQLDDATDAPDDIRGMLPMLRTLIGMANSALTDRAEAYASLGRLQSRVDAWMDGADATENILLDGVDAIREARGLPERWADAFFV